MSQSDPRAPRCRRRAPVTLLALACLLAAAPAPALAEEDAGASATPAVLDLTVNRIDGTPQALSEYRGRVVMIVNVASRCGYTPQYEGLERLYERYRGQGFVVLAFPSNDFAGQEPGSNREIADFCRSTYGVRFPLFEKLHVKGPEQHPLYARLTSQPPPIGGPVAWNFQKYLLDRSGRVVAKLPPAADPADPAVAARIEALLAAAP